MLTAMYDVKKMVREFISRSPYFFEDLSLPDKVDKKHDAIVRNAYDQIKDELSARNLRNWQHQSDMGAPAQLSADMFKIHGMFYTVARYLYVKLFKRQEDELFLNSLMDDISIINDIGGKKYLTENPVHETLGVGKFYQKDGYSFDMRWLRYIYLLTRILQGKMLHTNNVWVDVGSYYGGLQGLVKQYQPNLKMILVDFHHQLCRSFIYLKYKFPNSVHVFPDQLIEFSDFDTLPPGAIMYVPATKFTEVQDNHVDLATNFFSLGEMKKEYFKTYIDSNVFSRSKRSFIVNRLVSGPFFDTTYPNNLNIFDYSIENNRKITFFDIFPIHQFMIIRRPLFGRMSYRNASSAHFEMVTEKLN